MNLNSTEPAQKQSLYQKEKAEHIERSFLQMKQVQRGWVA